MLRILFVTTLLLTFVPYAGAHGCPHGQDPSAIAVGSFYVTPDGHVFEETGEHGGLQRTGGSNGGDDGRDPCSWNADRQVL